MQDKPCLLNGKRNRVSQKHLYQGDVGVLKRENLCYVERRKSGFWRETYDQDKAV